MQSRKKGDRDGYGGPRYDDLRVDCVLHTMLYVLNHSGSLSSLKLYKILYFADKEHLCRHGITASRDRYIAMEHGPVGSFARDIVECVRNNRPRGAEGKFLPSKFKPWIEVKLKSWKEREMVLVSARKKHFSEAVRPSGLEFFNAAIKKYRRMSVEKLSGESHDLAWEEAWAEAGKNKKKAALMRSARIAWGAGAPEEMQEYIMRYEE